MDLFFREVHAAFDDGHCADEPRPHVFREPFLAAEACEPAYILDVPLGVVLGRRRPAGDNVGDAVGFVLRGIGAEDAEGGAEAPFYALKLAKSPLPAPLLGECLILAAPMGARHLADVQRVVVAFSSIHSKLKIKKLKKPLSGSPLRGENEF